MTLSITVFVLIQIFDKHLLVFFDSEIHANKIVVLFIFVIPVFTLIKPGLHAKFIAPTYGYMGCIMTGDS